MTETVSEYTEAVESTVSDYEALVLSRLDTVNQGLEGIFNALWLLIGIVAVGIVIKFLWTVLSKWFFGGI